MPRLSAATRFARRATGSLAWPVQGQILRAYGEQPSGARNDGLDIAATEGSPVQAVEGGVVSYAGSDLQGYGNMLMITHADGLTSVYAHNRSLLVGLGTTVDRGQAIATVGRSGAVVEAQLHFQLRAGNRPVDPQRYLEGQWHRGRELGSSAGRPVRCKVIGHVVPPANLRAPRLVHSFPLPFRCQRADDNALTMALLAGCLIGLGLAWRVILGEVARGRILGAMARLATSVEAVEASEPQRLCPVDPAKRVEGMLGRPSRPQQYELAMWPEIAATRSAAKPKAAAPSSPSLSCLSVWCWPKRRSRLSQRRPGRERRVELEIVFDINSSFLAPAAISALRGLVRNCLMAVHIGWHCRQPSATTASGVRSPRRRSATIVGSPSVVSTGSPLGCASTASSSSPSSRDSSSTTHRGG